MRRLRHDVNLVVTLVFALWLLGHILGVWDHLFFETTSKCFAWPLKTDVKHLVLLERKGRPSPEYEYINDWGFRLLARPNFDSRPKSSPTLHLIVKSKIDHAEQRSNVRATWGRFTVAGRYRVRLTFLLGRSTSSVDMMATLAEARAHGDILLGNFHDTYRNNTFKTMMGFHWLVDRLGSDDLCLFADDDYHVSAENGANLGNFLLTDKEATDHGDLGPMLYVGMKVDWDGPHRVRTDKHYVSLDEYEFDAYPPYITAGSYLMSANTVRNLYLGSRYVAVFPFDDVFLGIVAYKIGLRLTQNELFVACHCLMDYLTPFNFSTVVAFHEFWALDALKEAEQGKLLGKTVFGCIGHYFGI